MRRRLEVGLEHDRPPDRSRCRDGPLDVRALRAGHERDPVCGKQGLAVRRLQPVAVILRVEHGVIVKPRRHSSTSGFGVDGIERGPLPERPGEPLAPLDRAR
jgi:hypothetical protein